MGKRGLLHGPVRLDPPMTSRFFKFTDRWLERKGRGRRICWDYYEAISYIQGDSECPAGRRVSWSSFKDGPKETCLPGIKTNKLILLVIDGRSYPTEPIRLNTKKGVKCSRDGRRRENWRGKKISKGRRRNVNRSQQGGTCRSYCFIERLSRIRQTGSYCEAHLILQTQTGATKAE